MVDMSKSAKDIVLKIFEKCAGNSGCEVCRPHMEDDCLFFPELYRLNDKTEDTGSPYSTNELCHLLDLCTLCGLCPCQDIRMLVLKAKTAFAATKKVSLSSRIISDVKTVGRWGTTFDKIANPLISLASAFPILKKTMDIHPDRHLPFFPKESFFLWAKKRGLNSQKDTQSQSQSKVAYFAGCSAGYLFPEVGKAAVRILEQSGVQVFVPPQECCGMPLMMEGNQKGALGKIHSNIETLFKSIQDGYDIVFSCSTCGYFFKKMLLENAYYSDAFQDSCGAGPDFMKVPTGSKKNTFSMVHKQMYKKILKDDGYFSSLDPLKRIEISKKIKDMGEYILSISAKNKLARSDYSNSPMMYYAPCHQREQDIGQPYYEILKSLPGSDIIQIGGVMDCCGMGGHLGYKADYHSHALKVGQPLFEKFLSHENRTIVTDCLSCKMQFQQTLSMDVFHPLELISPN
jgi:glycerol-3-phosphate dehydrogenase subunit C